MNRPLYILLFKAFHVHRQRSRRDMLCYHLSPGQPKVLRYLAKHDGCMMKDIALHCDVEPATVSKIIDSLEDKGLLKRQINPNNKRSYQLTMTPQGLETLQKWEVHTQEIEDVSLQGFTPEEKEQFKNYLQRMYDNLNEKVSDKEGN